MNTQETIINELNVRNDQTNISEIVRERVDLLKNLLKGSKQRSLVLGISGGVDSLTAGLMAQQAVNELNDEEYECRFVAVKLPYAVQADALFVELALDTIQPSKIEICNIQSIVNEVEQWLDDPMSNHDDHGKDFIRGNIKARTRMLVQYTLANCYEGLVIGTDHAAEAVTGFFTKFGDGACDVVPLSGLVKQTVRNIAKWYGAPEELYSKPATADLEDLSVNLLDEDALGISYEDIDNFLLGKVVPKDVEEKIIDRYTMTMHKREQPIAVSNETSTSSGSTVDYMYTVERSEFNVDILEFIEKLEFNAKKQKITVYDLLKSFDDCAELLDGLSYKADEFYIWYYNNHVDDMVSFEGSKYKVSRLTVGTGVSLDSNDVGTMVDYINNNEKVNSTISTLREYGLKPSLKEV